MLLKKACIVNIEIISMICYNLIKDGDELMKTSYNFDEELWSALNHLVIKENNIVFFLNVLKETNNVDFWLILPLELAKTHDIRLVPILIDLLQDPRTVGHRGNFLTALAEYDYLPYSDILIDFICDECWELRTKSAEMLLQIKDRLPNEILCELEKRTKCALDAADEKCEFLCEIMQDFDIVIN